MIPGFPPGTERSKIVPTALDAGFIAARLVRAKVVPQYSAAVESRGNDAKATN